MPDGTTDDQLQNFLFDLDKVIAARKLEKPENSYTAKLFQGGIDRLLQKVGEESIEYILEAKNNDRERTISEAADLLFHFLVSLHGINLSLNDVLAELRKRHKK